MKLSEVLTQPEVHNKWNIKPKTPKTVLVFSGQFVSLNVSSLHWLQICSLEVAGQLVFTNSKLWLHPQPTVETELVILSAEICLYGLQALKNEVVTPYR